MKKYTFRTDSYLRRLFNNKCEATVELHEVDLKYYLHRYSIKEGNDLYNYYFYLFKFWKVFSTENFEIRKYSI